MAAATKRVGTLRPGGRAERVRTSILDAALAELLERGPNVSLPDIARRAGVQKTSLYRRYPTRAALLLDVATARASEAIPIADTGSLSADLVRVLERARKLVDSPVGRALLSLSLAAEAPDDVAAVRAYWRARLRALEVLFDRARSRGEWPVRARSAPVVELLVGSIWFQALTGQPRQSRATLRTRVAAVLEAAGAMQGPPARGRRGGS